MWDGRDVKPKRPHPDRALTALKVRAIKEPGRYADGNGLYLLVDRSGAKRWMLRTVVRGKRCDIGLGGLRLVSLAESREQAQAYRKLARAGDDPLVDRRRRRRVIPTFAEAARSVHQDHKSTWRNAKHRAQWLTTLEAYVFPQIGDKRVDQIDTADVLRTLSPIWLAKPETARRVRQRIGTVLDWAKAAGFRQGDNPVGGVSLGLPKQVDRQRHHPALPFDQVPAFIGALREAEGSEVTRLAFEFLILTAGRTAEVVAAQWREIDFSTATWSIPGLRMKAGRPHAVPLAPRCLDILTRARQLAGDSEYVFPGRSLGKPLSNMAFLMTLRRMQLGVTAHGFRSAFRDWAAERTNFPREVCEMALAHTIKDKAEAAYRRGDLREKRRELMGTWAGYCESDVHVAEVVALRATRRHQIKP